MPSIYDRNYYLAVDVRKLDLLAIEEHHVPGFTLMQRAGKASVNALLEKWPATDQLLCFCGSGNNGGDGYIIAALASAKGIHSTVIAVGSTDKLKGDARKAYEMAADIGVKIVPLPIVDINFILEYSVLSVLVDAMLGTGLTGKVRGDYQKAIELINTISCPTVAVDIPSGLCSDSGKILGDVVNADLTVTFIGRKLGQVIAEGPEFCGEIVFDDLGVPGEIYKFVTPVTT